MKEQMCVIFLYRAFIDSLSKGYESIYLFEFLEVLKLIFPLFFFIYFAHYQCNRKSPVKVFNNLKKKDFCFVRIFSIYYMSQ